MGDNVLFVDNVVSGYGKMDIVQDVSIRVDQNEIVVIIGSNGCGKSTLLKTIFGFVRPTAGCVSFNGEDVTGVKPFDRVKKGMAYVPQTDNVFPTLSIMENLEMGGYITDGIDTADIFDIFPVLREKKKEKASSLSGGEKQMLALGRALMTHPKLVLLDEPSAGLAPKMVEVLMNKIQEIKDGGSSVLLIEQNVKSALRIADRGYILVMGKKVYEGDASEVLDHKEIGRLYLGKKTR